MAKHNFGGLIKVDGHTIVDIRTAASKIVEKFCQLPIEGRNGTRRRSDQEGGYLCIINTQNCGIMMPQDAIGFFLPEKKKKYFEFSLEKAQRLFRHSEHSSSHQSRDEKKDQYGGAIRTKHLIVSFSGLPELGDEAVVLILAIYLGWLTLAQAKIIATLSKNKHFSLLYDRVFPVE